MVTGPDSLGDARWNCIRFVRSEPLIDHVDNNPFDVATNLRAMITSSLEHLHESIR